MPKRYITAMYRCAAHALWLGGEIFAYLRGKRFRFRVQGDSMCPSLGDGDVILIDTTSRGLPDTDTVVVAKDPTEPARMIVKRVRSQGQGTVFLGSDDPNVGRDSRHFGSVPAALILGPVSLVWKAGRLKFVRPRPSLR